MNSYVTISFVVAAVVIISLGSYLIHSYGQAEYQSGYNTALQEQSAASARSQIESSRRLEDIDNDTRNMSSDAIDTDLIELGIMRAREDR